MRILIPAILLIAAVASFVLFTSPTYKEVKALKAEASQYDEALTNSQKLQAERDTLSAKYRSFPAEDLSRLENLLPDSADNIRLIIDLQRMAQSYGMSLSSIRFDTNQSAAAAASPLSAGTPAEVARSLKDYGTFRMEFSTTATYENFLKFLKDIESSLRLTDVETIDFSSDTQNQGGQYAYTVKLKTYWLKR